MPFIWYSRAISAVTFVVAVLCVLDDLKAFQLGAGLFDFIAWGGRSLPLFGDHLVLWAEVYWSWYGMFHPAIRAPRQREN
jgi:hypothetical protein